MARAPKAAPASTDFKPVYALVGSDPFLQLQKLKEVIGQLPADMQRADFDGERAELAEVLDELRSFAMFGGGKLVAIRNADALLTRFRESLEAYVLAPAPGAVLVLRLASLPSTQRIAKAIAKVGVIEPCEAPKARDLPQWVIHRAEAHRIKIDPAAARMLCDLIGDDLGRLDNELAKLALGDQPRITQKEVGAAVAFQREQEMWDMTNALAAGQTTDALRRWRRLVQLDSSAEFRAVTWLAIWLENVRKALAMRRSGMNEGAIASTLRIWPREQQEPFFRTAAALGELGAADAIDRLAQVDLRSKTGVGEAAANVEQFILQLAPGSRQ